MSIFLQQEIRCLIRLTRASISISEQQNYTDGAIENTKEQEMNAEPCRNLPIEFKQPEGSDFRTLTTNTNTTFKFCSKCNHYHKAEPLPEPQLDPALWSFMSKPSDPRFEKESPVKELTMLITEKNITMSTKQDHPPRPDSPRKISLTLVAGKKGARQSPANSTKIRVSQKTKCDIRRQSLSPKKTEDFQTRKD